MINKVDDKITELPSQKKKKNKNSQGKNNKRIEDTKKTMKVEYNPKKVEIVTKYVKVILNGRDKPNFDGEIIKIYQPNTPLQIVEENGEWSKTSEGIYVKTEFLQ